MKYLYIPTLTGESAQEFLDKAECNERLSESEKEDFTDKINTIRCILHKSGFIISCDNCHRKKQIKGYNYLVP